MFKRIYLIAIGLGFFMATPLAAQFQSVPANFIIKKINYQSQNDKLRMRLDLQVESSSGELLEGIGVLSMCGCYCDSIWDAWPSEVGGPGIPGTGTLHYSNNGGQGAPGLPQNGVLGIRMVDGGIDRETDFNVWVKFLWVE